MEKRQLAYEFTHDWFKIPHSFFYEKEIFLRRRFSRNVCELFRWWNKLNHAFLFFYIIPIKWCLTSTCLSREWSIGFLVWFMALVLLHLYKLLGILGLIDGGSFFSFMNLKPWELSNLPHNWHHKLILHHLIKILI